MPCVITYDYIDVIIVTLCILTRTGRLSKSMEKGKKNPAWLLLLWMFWQHSSHKHWSHTSQRNTLHWAMMEVVSMATASSHPPISPSFKSTVGVWVGKLLSLPLLLFLSLSVSVLHLCFSIFHEHTTADTFTPSNIIFYYSVSCRCVISEEAACGWCH